MNQKTIWLNFILLLSVGLSVFLIFMKKYNIQGTELPSGINAFMTKLTYVNFNKTGGIHSQLTAQQMKHYIRYDTSIFTHPKILIYTDKGIPWYITSNYGKSQKDNKKIFFYKEVKLYQPSQPTHPETSIYTQNLIYYPDRSFAKTNKKVIMKQPELIINGTGLKADLKKGVITLLKQSRGVYTPKPKLESQ